MNWYFLVWKKYADFSGRSRRKEYWYFTLFHTIVLAVLSLIDSATGTLNPQIGLGLLSGIYGLAALLPSLAVTVRRLHDLGQSGLWCLVLLIPFIGALALLIAMAIDGQAKDNQFGPNPKDAPA